MSNQNLKISDLDPRHAANRMFDSDNDAQRVVIVGGGLSLAGEVVAPSNSQVQTIEVPTIVKEVQIVEIEKQVIVKEYEKIEIPLVIETIRTVEIEKPILVTEYKLIETQVIVKEPVEFPNWLKVVLVTQAVVMTVCMILNIVRK